MFQIMRRVRVPVLILFLAVSAPGWLYAAGSEDKPNIVLERMYNFVYSGVGGDGRGVMRGAGRRNIDSST